MGSLHNRSLHMFLFAAIAIFAFTLLPSVAHGVSPNIFADRNQSGVEDANVQSALSTILWWVYLVFKIIAIIVVGWSMLEIRNGELTKGFFGVLSAIGLFFTPALVELARKLGEAAAS